MAIEGLHYEAVMERAAREQCIFVLVEGDSEEVAISVLLNDMMRLNSLGIKIANYNGHGNLQAALRLLKQTLSHDRPIILTYDNDPPSLKSIEKCEKQGLFSNLVYRLPIPSKPVVEYPCGHRGGSFEESFPVDLFLRVTFTELLPPSIRSKRSLFEADFDPKRPWLLQLRRFTAGLGFTGWNAKKPMLAESLACGSEEIPPTYRALADLIMKVRDKHPVVHPDDVELPKVHGLTYLPERSEGS